MRRDVRQPRREQRQIGCAVVVGSVLRATATTVCAAPASSVLAYGASILSGGFRRPAFEPTSAERAQVRRRESRAVHVHARCFGAEGGASTRRSAPARQRSTSLKMCSLRVCRLRGCGPLVEHDNAQSAPAAIHRFIVCLPAMRPLSINFTLWTYSTVPSPAVRSRLTTSTETIALRTCSGMS